MIQGAGQVGIRGFQGDDTVHIARAAGHVEGVIALEAAYADLARSLNRKL